MGVEIVKAATVYGRALSGNAYKALVAMSLSALDKPSNGRPASLYWGGWDALAVALGHDNADRGSAGHNAVARAVRELRAAGHITSMVEAGRGMRQSYMVHPGGLKPRGQGEQNAHAKGEQIAHAKGEQNAHVGVSKMLTPRNEQGSKGLTQDTNTHPATSTTDHAGEGSSKTDSASGQQHIEPHGHTGDHDEPCQVCGHTKLNLIHARHHRRKASGA